MLRVGDFLQDRYEILEQIGSGGMSTVYKAHCHKLKRNVAIKVLKEEFCGDSNFVKKFKMEAQAAAGLMHPNIVNIYDVVDEGQLHYIVMELVEGITLKSYIMRKGHLEIRESIGIAIQVAQGIAAAHEHGLVHRDIKPQNMLISKDGKVKVADFGIARAVSEQTMNSVAAGSVHYISPEQARGGISDERSDIYSLGITLYEMVTGRVPFDGETTVAVALAHLENAMVPPSVYRPDLLPELEHIICKCTEKKPDRRYGSVKEVIHDLRQVLILLQKDTVVAAPSVKHGLSRGPETEEAQDELPGTRQFTESEMKQIQKARKEAPAAAPKKKKHTGMKEEHEDVNPNLQRLLAGAGILAAFLIVFVMIQVFVKLGGVFYSGSKLFGKSEKTEEIVSEINDTQTYMPDVSNLPLELAQEKMKESFLNMKVEYEYSDTISKGNIIRQNPVEGTIVDKWSKVNVVVSNGSDKVNLAEMNLNAMNLEDAKKLLESRKLSVMIEEAESDIYEKGTIISYEPVMAAEGSSVTLYVSKGPHVDLIEIPDITGLEEVDAIATLVEAGLMPGEVIVRPDAEVEAGCVISQSGGENGMIEAGGTVNYILSSGEPGNETEPQSPSAGENVAGFPKQRYVASINKTFDMKYLVGPGAGSYNITIMIRLHQKAANGDDVYRILTGPKTVPADVLLPVSYTSIESMTGTDQGELEVVDVENGVILKSYRLTFFSMD